MLRRRKKMVTRLKVVLFSIWIALVSLYFLWEAVGYRGLTAILAEWQFDTIGRFYPTLTYVLIVLLLAMPGYLLFLRPRSRANQPYAAAIRSGRVFGRALVGVAGGLAAAALVTLIAILWLPGTNDQLQRFVVSKQSAVLPREGLTELTGSVAYDRTAAFEQQFVITRTTQRFAPVLATADNDRILQFFIELPPIDTPPAAGIQKMTGVLRQGGLPGELLRLYRYAGYEIDQPYYVLFIDPAVMRWPYINVAVQLLIGALIAAIAAFFQMRRVRRVRRTAREKQGASAVNSPA